MGGSMKSRGLDRDNELTPEQRMAEAAWLATRDDRRARVHRNGFCLTKVAPYGGDDPLASRVHDVCRDSGCLDLLHELLARMLAKLGPDGSATAISDTGAYYYRVATRELVEIKRGERTALGFPAKPTRLDGAAGRVDAALRAGDETSGEWLGSLLRIMLAYPYSPHHVAGRWPVDGLATERAHHYPHEADQPDAVRHDIATVLACATDVAGRQWVYDNLTLPLNSSGPSTAIPETMAVEPRDETHALTGRLLAQAYRKHRAKGLAKRDAFTAAVLEVTGLEAPRHTRAIEQALSELESPDDDLPATG